MIGLILGSAVAVALTQLMKSILYGVSTTDPLTFGIAAILVMTAAATACYFPARSAMKVDPMVALRSE